MLTKPLTCEACPLVQSGQGFCPDSGNPSVAEIVLHGEAPGTQEIAQGKPFVGDSGFVLHQWGLSAVPDLKLRVEQGKAMFVNVLRCLPEKVQGRPYPTGDTRKLAESHCRQYDAPWPQATTVVLLGEVPQRFYFGAELDAEDALDAASGRGRKGVLGRVGRVYERDGKRWIFAPHPAFVLRQPALVVHLQEALRIAVNKERQFQVTEVPWPS